MRSIKKMTKFLAIILVLFIISVVLYITGKRHDIFIENNSQASIKYSINGEAYKDIAPRKKAKEAAKGLNNVIFIKTNDGKLIEKDLPLGISKDINIYIKEAISDSSENWYEEIK